MECHAFLCPKRKVTQAVTLTVAKAFNAAYEAWRKNEEKRNLIIGECSKSIEASANQSSQQATIVRSEKGHDDDITDKNSSMLIDFNSDMTENENLHHNSWVCFCFCFVFLFFIFPYFLFFHYKYYFFIFYSFTYVIFSFIFFILYREFNKYLKNL